MKRGPLVVTVIALVALGLLLFAWQKRTATQSPSSTDVTALDASRSASTPSRPNIVLISIDAVRPDHLSCYGHHRPTSPHIDRVAAQGVLFERCTAQAPWTLQSHMSLFTSMLPSHNGVDNLNKILPPNFVTLAQVMREEGYHTAALVNNGQMRAHWGFDRGFETWREYEVDTPAAAADQLTDRVLEWLGEHDRDEPYFLFLHYYDAHDPYEAPPEWRQKFGVKINGNQARRMCFAYRTPEHNSTDPAEMEQLRAAYDAEIAWMDHKLGRIFDVLPPETLIIIFSDHGECFEEHGWTLHGATLFEQDIRTPLIVRPPASWNIPPQRVGASVMLMDVAPTLLSMVGVRPHPQFVGDDLSPLWNGGGDTFPQRLIPSETKAVLEGRYLLGVTAGNLKATYSHFDGTFDLRQLPDELEVAHTPEELASAETLFAPLRQWIRGEQFWMLEATGGGDHEIIIRSPQGPPALFIPAGLDPQRDKFEVSDDGSRLLWHVYPGASNKRKMLLVQLVNAGAPLEIDYRHNGERHPAMLRVGPEAAQPSELPVTFDGSLPPSDPLILAPPADAPRVQGLRVTRHADPSQPARDTVVAPLDEQTLQQLRSLGYIQ